MNYQWTQIPVVDSTGTILWTEYGLRTPTAVCLVTKDRAGRGWLLLMHRHEPAIGIGYRWHGPAAVQVTPAPSGDLFFHSAEAARGAAEDVLNHDTAPHILLPGKDGF